MKTTSSVLVIGQIVPESVARKTVNDKALTEFQVEDCGLRISAWEARAAAVPNSGIVIVNGYLATRTYQYEGKDRTSTDIRATSIQVIEGTAVDAAEPF